ncbi:MAG: hypothetical protein KDA42_14715, partial [Planctomycetales bacterium]|nr:hypothetical protein [Planctomycetales bacterium]
MNSLPPPDEFPTEVDPSGVTNAAPPANTPAEASPTSVAAWWRSMLTRPLRLPVRLAIFYAGVALPVACHWLTMFGPPQSPTWQSGSL